MTQELHSLVISDRYPPKCVINVSKDTETSEAYFEFSLRKLKLAILLDSQLFDFIQSVLKIVGCSYPRKVNLENGSYLLIQPDELGFFVFIHVKIDEGYPESRMFSLWLSHKEAKNITLHLNALSL